MKAFVEACNDSILYLSSILVPHLQVMEEQHIDILYFVGSLENVFIIFYNPSVPEFQKWDLLLQFGDFER